MPEVPPIAAVDGRPRTRIPRGGNDATVSDDGEVAPVARQRGGLPG